MKYLNEYVVDAELSSQFCSTYHPTQHREQPKIPSSPDLYSISSIRGRSIRNCNDKGTLFNF